MKKIHINRLKKLADHLRNGKLGHQEFYFGAYNKTTYDYDKKGCGTMGCAIGECPIIFRDWKFKLSSKSLGLGKFIPIYKNYRKPHTSGEKFFGINTNEYRHLFIPSGQKTYWFGGKFLEKTATKKQVAANIEAFIKLKTN